MKICISGASGLVGQDLSQRLKEAGHSLVALSRSGRVDGSVRWDPERGELNAGALADVDAVVHLAGESIAEGRWTQAKKQRIRDSRVKSTTLLAETLARMPEGPRTLISASAIGYYGDRGDEICSEDSPPGEGFLPEVCLAWEESCAAAEQAGLRVVKLRIGLVMSPKGGALAKMLLPFRMGGGGVLGSGRQYVSWIALEDLVRMIEFALGEQTLSGPHNAVAPEPVTNAEFTKTLGHVLHRPTLVPMPAFAARLAFGEMADALLLASTRVIPKRIQQAGFAFRYPQLEAALRSML